MAAPSILDTESDYGSDISPEDELHLIELASQSHQQAPASASLPPRTGSYNTSNVDLLPGRTDIVGENDALVTESIGVPETLQIVEPNYSESLVAVSDITNSESFDKIVTYPDLSRALSDAEAIRNGDGHDKALGDENMESEDFEDDRSPLQRFRSYPKRPLTVTDLTAGAWCELQYWYTLTKLPGGRRTKTPAMKGGSKIHKKLEDEVHTTIQVDVLTKEDAFALRMWNFIQGMRTLRETGLTREVEVWGMVHGNFVNGVIDALSHENPNPEFEKELAEQAKVDPKQTSLMSFVTRNGKPADAAPSPKVYLVDVKTRGSLAPVTKALLRPAKIQLLLYHRFLSDIAAGRLDFFKVFRRYGLDADDTFSDGFIAQMGDLHDEIFQDSQSSETSAESFDSRPGSGVLKYQTLRELLPLMKEEIHLTFPEGDKSMGSMLRVQYVHRDDGREIDVHDFPVSTHALDNYLTQYMQWWQGERKAKGVEIEEAFKCRTCEFAADCTWRNAKAEGYRKEAHDKAQARRQASESSSTYGTMP